MDETYRKIREYARQLVAEYPVPEFYSAHAKQVKQSDIFFRSSPIVKDIYNVVAETIDKDFGHGLHHVTKVAKDAGTIMMIEAGEKNWHGARIKNKMVMVHTAGLLHDIKRQYKNHAMKSADFAEAFLQNYPFSDDEIREICAAIKNHEAFTCSAYKQRNHSFLSDCLYDADKFRWGPDNFTHTVWDMVSSANIPLSSFIMHYPKGLDGINKIKRTFRTSIGQHYGPEFIDIGLLVGERLLEIIKKEFTGNFLNHKKNRRVYE